MKLSKFLSFLLLPTLVVALSFPLAFAPESFLTTAPWIFKAITELPVSVDDCWNIITDDGAWQFWFPEVTNIRNIVPPGVGGNRLVDFNLKFTNKVVFILLLGPVTLDEYFDIWEPNGSTRRYSYYIQSTSRPNFMTYTMARNEYVCETSGSNSVFTKTVALEPGILTNALSFITRPAFEELFLILNPRRLLEAIEAGQLPRST